MSGHFLIPRASPGVAPWDHLRGNEFPTHTYLNKLKPEEYKAAAEAASLEVVLFESRDINHNAGGQEGEKFLTPEVAGRTFPVSQGTLISPLVLYHLQKIVILVRWSLFECSLLSSIINGWKLLKSQTTNTKLIASLYCYIAVKIDLQHFFTGNVIVKLILQGGNYFPRFGFNDFTTGRSIHIFHQY